jgi:hypothetical protein
MFALRHFLCQSKAVKRSASPVSRPFALASTLFALVNICAYHSSADLPSASTRFEDSAGQRPGARPSELRVGQAGHAFDHLGNIGAQAEAAAASGATIIYATGLGAFGYQGLPSPEELRRQRETTAIYNRAAKRRGIRLVLGYVCATSMVKLDAFDRNWPPDFRAQFRTPPSDWRQQDRQGHPLPSWYGGEYQPACMNNPDWRAYERFVVRQQLESGHDGIFFDNPTVHPQGCYCPHCLDRFAQFLKREGVEILLTGGAGTFAGEYFEGPPAGKGAGAPGFLESLLSSIKACMERNRARRTGRALTLTQRERLVAASATNWLAEMRQLAIVRSNDFLRFRCTVARDFLADMRDYARRLNRPALITANNSLNSANALYSQCRAYGYNIYEMSQAEDFVVVEDMSSLPRVLPGGQVIEYAPTYQQLLAIAHGRPVVAVSLAEADYHTPPNLVRLAMAEAAANGASHLWWPTWPEPERARMTGAIRPQAEFLRNHAPLLNHALPRREVVLFLPFRRWIETDQCVASQLAAALSRAHVQYEVICEDDLRTGRPFKGRGGVKVFLVESRSLLTADEEKVLARFCRDGGRLIAADRPEWLRDVQAAIGPPAVAVRGPPTLRVTVRDQPRRTIVHVLNLNVQRLSSFADKVGAAEDVRVTVRVPFKEVRSVRALTADAGATAGLLSFSAQRTGAESEVELTLPRLEMATLLVIER